MLGGRRACPVEQAILAEEFGRANVPGHVNTLGITHIGPTIMVHGIEAQKSRSPRTSSTPSEIECQLYSEPNAGSRSGEPGDGGRRDRDDHVVSSHKRHI